MEHDLAITGATIHDGGGGEGFRGDVAIRDGRISALGRIDGRARRTIDADGLVVCPGFVDTSRMDVPGVTHDQRTAEAAEGRRDMLAAMMTGVDRSTGEPLDDGVGLGPVPDDVPEVPERVDRAAGAGVRDRRRGGSDGGARLARQQEALHQYLAAAHL